MPTAFERGAQKGFDRMSGFLLTDKSAGHYEYVGIIVLACETCYLFLPAQSGPYSLMFIECHGYSVPDPQMAIPGYTSPASTALASGWA